MIARTMMRSLLFLLLLLTLTAHAQLTLTGRVVNGETDEPLPFASVFLANTTKGTTADDKGSFTLTNLQAGRFEMVVSSVGYETFSFPVYTDKPKTYVIRLKPSTDLMEVKVKARRSPNWDKHLSFFIQNFIGTSQNALNCRLLNPKVVWFDEDDETHVLKAGANEPLIIENNALGYRIKYLLESFVYDKSQHFLSYLGHPVLEEMEARSPRQAKRWMENRRTTYYGSTMHFMRALHTRCVGEEGFVLNRIAEQLDIENQRPGKEPIKTRILVRKILPVDSLIDADSSSASVTMLKFRPLIQVTYLKEKEETEYSRTHAPLVTNRDRIGQVSVLHMLSPNVLVEANGNYYEPLGILFEGYWSWEKVAEMLPLNYEPDEGK